MKLQLQDIVEMMRHKFKTHKVTSWDVKSNKIKLWDIMYLDMKM